MNRAVFLDRDGTLIVDRGYLKDPGEVALLPGVPEALRKLKAAGCLLVVVTNQSGIGRGYFTHDDVLRAQARLEALLAEEGVILDGHYYCPHGPDEHCPCRKPAPGMLQQAARDLTIDLAASAMIGDKASDAEAGMAAGCGRNFRIGAAEEGGAAYEMVSDLPEAARRILDRPRQ